MELKNEVKNCECTEISVCTISGISRKVHSEIILSVQMDIKLYKENVHTNFFLK